MIDRHQIAREALALQRFVESPLEEVITELVSRTESGAIDRARGGELGSDHGALRTDRWDSLGLGVAAIAVVVAGFALSVGIEFTQIYFPPRTVSLNDIGAETIQETAISIMGEILAVRAGRGGGPLREAGQRIHAQAD